MVYGVTYGTVFRVQKSLSTDSKVPHFGYRGHKPYILSTHYRGTLGKVYLCYRFLCGMVLQLYVSQDYWMVYFRHDVINDYE